MRLRYGSFLFLSIVVAIGVIVSVLTFIHQDIAGIGSYLIPYWNVTSIYVIILGGYVINVRWLNFFRPISWVHAAITLLLFILSITHGLSFCAVSGCYVTSARPLFIINIVILGIFGVIDFVVGLYLIRKIVKAQEVYNKTAATQKNRTEQAESFYVANHF